MSDFLSDFAQGRWDVPFWAKRFLGITIHPGQVRMAEAYLARDQSGWRAAYHTLAISAGNRAGKTMALAIVILHSTFYKMGTKPPLDTSDAEMDRWRKRPYFWFHFAIQQEIAELVYTEIINIFQGIHVAQKEGRCPLVEEIAEAGGTAVAEWEKKYNGDYRWIVLDPFFGGGQIHFRTTAERALGSLGRDMHGVSFDECGFEPKLQYIVDNVLHLRRLGTGGQLFLVSTPEEGLTSFADLWYMGDPEQPDRSPRRMSIRMSTRENIGYGIDQVIFDQLTEGMDEDHIKQNIDGYFIQGRSAYFNVSSVDRAFVKGLPEVQAAKNRHSYCQGMDLALKVDSVWSIVFDVIWDKATDVVTAYGVMVQQLRGKKKVGDVVELAKTVHLAYDVNRAGIRSTCATAIDATSYGGQMFKELMDEGIPGGVHGIVFGGSIQKKRKLLGDLRVMLDQGRLVMPRSGLWLRVRRQLAGYKIDDRHIEQDAVMALACAVAEIKRTPGEAVGSVSFDFYTTDEPKPVEDDFWAPRKPAN